MATTTKVYGLKKPSLTDIYNIMDFNNNFDKIDDVLNTKTEIEDIGTLNGTESVFNTQISPGFYKGIWNNQSMKQKGDFTLFVFDVSSVNTAEDTKETAVMQVLFHENQVSVRLGVLGVPVNWGNFSPIATMSNVSNIEQKIGNLSNLTTTAKENIVAVINELITSISKKADKVTNNGFVAGGAEAGKAGSISIGSGISSTGEYGIAIGAGAEGANDSVSIGHGSIASGIDSVAIGDVAESLAQNAVQIGNGSNSESESLQFRRYKIVRYDTTDDRYYLKDVGHLGRLYTTNQSSIVDAINELENEAENNTAELLSKITEQNNSLIMLIQMLANTGINIVPLLEMLGNTITVIPDTVTQIYQYSDNNNPDNKLKGIVYAPNLETVELRSIDDNSGMTTIIMPKVKTIKNQGFWASYGLKTVFIPNCCTSIGAETFNYCSKLKYIIVDKEKGELSNAPFYTYNCAAEVIYLRRKYETN